MGIRKESWVEKTLRELQMRLFLARHGQSIWNAQNRFTGWIDVPLSQLGMQEAIELGEHLREQDINVIYTSRLMRSSMTALLAMVHLGKESCIMHEDARYETTLDTALIPVYMTEAFNERHYGILQGHNKDKMIAIHGSTQIQQWRRSFREAPPQGESLYDTKMRAVSVFVKDVIPLLSTHNVLICAHGNSLRALIMHIESLSEVEIPLLEIATGQVRAYDYHEGVFTKR